MSTLWPEALSLGRIRCFFLNFILFYYWFDESWKESNYIKKLELSSGTDNIDVHVQLRVHLVFDLPEDIGVIANLAEVDHNVAQSNRRRLI